MPDIRLLAQVDTSRLRTSVSMECAGCGVAILVYASRVERSGRHYCSVPCRTKNRGGLRNSRWHGGKQTRSCAVCSQQFQCDPGVAETRRFCSTKCMGIAKRTYPSRRDQRAHGEARRRARKAKISGGHTYAEWAAVIKRYGGRCARCGKAARLTRDHILAITKGGSDNIENIQPLCKPCNSSKGNRRTHLL